ncbi:NUDIX hydrolase [Microbacterium gorillae]|uniref:NUDIX hydrolase n=1 Tax=Microbacterium gorillae TaxID=1231063 RepID=UPI0005906933|nr:NUDIX hydrolase [Microbacterium gorillae]
MSAPDLAFTEYDTRVAAYAVIVDERGMLLSWWNGGATPERASWTLPGGGVDFAEQIEDAVIREVREETGYDAELTGFLFTHSWWDRNERNRPFKAVRIVYSARITGGTLGTLEVGGSTDRAAWLPLAELDELTPQVRLLTLALDAWRAAQD